MAAEHEITIRQWSTFRESFLWQDENDAPISVADYEARLQIRRKRKLDAEILLDLQSVGSDPALTLEPDGETGRIDVEIPANTTAGLERGGQYDLLLYDPLDPTEAVRLVEGEVKLIKAATARPA